MLIINVKKIKKIVSELCIEANINLRKDILAALKAAAKREPNKTAKAILNVLIENANIAKKEKYPICQDTGMACVYLDIGQGVRLSGGDLEKAINDGVRDGYKKGYLRDSIVDAITRKNTTDNAPAVIHERIVKGNKIKITVVPKGFGCENKNQIRMFKPTEELGAIKEFIINAVKTAGPDACPPFVVGVGIGGTFEKAAELSKEALLRNLYAKRSTLYAKLESDLLKEINSLNIGPMGLGGRTTALAVNIETYPTHIAGLPVAVSVGCHAMRMATKTV